MEIIAVASSDGRRIDTHFGQARKFHIYGIDEAGAIEKKTVRPVAERSENTGGSLPEYLAALLSDTDIVLCAGLGPGAEAALESVGVKGFAFPGEIESALKNYAKRRNLLKNLSRSEASLIDSCLNRGGCGGCGDGSGLRENVKITEG